MTAEVYVTGVGAFSAFGFGVESLAAGVFGGVEAFGPVNRFDTHGFTVDRAATCLEADNSVAAAIACAREALAMASWDGDDPLSLALGSTLRASASDAYPADAGRAVAEGLGLTGGRRTFVNACCAAANAVVHGSQLIRGGRADAVLVGGAFVLDRQAYGIFDSARALATDGRLRPFDRDRKGVLLGDGGGMLLLESARSVRARGAVPVARVSGWSMTDDAYHLAKPHPEGAGVAAAITQALRRGGIAPRHLDYLNAHATGTPLNDAAEAAGIHTALGAHVDEVPVSGTKGTTGHTLEASGALEAVIAVLGIRESRLPPTRGLEHPDTVNPLRHVLSSERATVKSALSINSSVGGLNAAVLLEAS